MNKKLLETVLRILRERAEDYERHGDLSTALGEEAFALACAYQNAADMLEYAMLDGAEYIAQFDTRADDPTLSHRIYTLFGVEPQD